MDTDSTFDSRMFGACSVAPRQSTECEAKDRACPPTKPSASGEEGERARPFAVGAQRLRFNWNPYETPVRGPAASGRIGHPSQHGLQNSTIAVVGHFDRRVDAAGRVESQFGAIRPTRHHRA